MAIPAARTEKPVELVRVNARKRFLFASAGFALGSVFLSAALAFLLGNESVGGLTGLILGTLLEGLGLVAATYAAFTLARAFPLSEVLGTSRKVLLACVAVVLPLAAVGTGAWLAFLVRDPKYYLIPAFPLFWGPLSAVAAIGFVYAARELASERMAILAAVGGGGIVIMALSASGASLFDPFRTLISARFVGDLLLVALGFAAIAVAFRQDAWVARARRTP